MTLNQLNYSNFQ